MSNYKIFFTSFVFFILAILTFVFYKNVNKPLQKNKIEKTVTNNIKVFNTTSLKFPIDVSSLNKINSKVKKVESGVSHTLVLFENGELYAYGDNTYKQLGVDEKEEVGSFTPIKIDFDRKVTDVATSGYHNLALLENGDVYSWGLNLSHQVNSSDDEFVFTKTKVLEQAKMIGAGYRFSLAIDKNNKLWGWGMSCTDANVKSITEHEEEEKEKGEEAEEGYYSTTTEKGSDLEDCYLEQNLPINSKTPKQLDWLSDYSKIKDLKGGYGHVLLLTTDGDLYTIGCNAWGQLGINRFKYEGERVVTKINYLPAKVKYIDASYRHSLIQLENNDIMVSGYTGDFDEKSQVIKYSSFTKIGNSKNAPVAGADVSIYFDGEKLQKLGGVEVEVLKDLGNPKLKALTKYNITSVY